MALHIGPVAFEVAINVGIGARGKTCETYGDKDEG